MKFIISLGLLLSLCPSAFADGITFPDTKKITTQSIQPLKAAPITQETEKPAESNTKNQQQVMIPAGTQIPISSNYTINSNHVKAGDMIAITVNEAVTVNGRNVFKPGASGILYIGKSIPSRPCYGQAGHLVINSGYVTDIEGNKHFIHVVCSEKGISKRKRAMLLSATIILLPFGVFTEGKPAFLQAGRYLHASTSKNMTLNLASTPTQEQSR